MKSWLGLVWIAFVEMWCCLKVYNDAFFTHRLCQFCSHMGGLSADVEGKIGPLLDDGSFVGTCIAKVCRMKMK